MLRVVVPARRARSSIRYSPEALTPCGWRAAASKSCDTAVSMNSRDWRRTRLGARRTLYRTLAIVPGSGRDGRSGAISVRCSGRRGGTRSGVVRYRVIVGEPEIPHLAKILRGEPGVPNGDISQWRLWCKFTQGVTVRARFNYPATRHAAPRFPWLRMRDMTQSREPDDGA